MGREALSLPAFSLKNRGDRALKRIALIVFVSLALCIALKAPLYAIDIGATGGWTGLVIGSSCLVGSAGSDLTSAYESWESATTINVTNTSGNNDAWRVKCAWIWVPRGKRA